MQRSLVACSLKIRKVGGGGRCGGGGGVAFHIVGHMGRLHPKGMPFVLPVYNHVQKGRENC